MVSFRRFSRCDTISSSVRRPIATASWLMFAWWLCAGASSFAQVGGSVLLSDIPETRSRVTLSAVNDPKTGKGAFSFNGVEDPPVIRVAPGETLKLTYDNK